MNWRTTMTNQNDQDTGFEEALSSLPSNDDETSVNLEAQVQSLDTEEEVVFNTGNTLPLYNKNVTKQYDVEVPLSEADKDKPTLVTLPHITANDLENHPNRKLNEVLVMDNATPNNAHQLYMAGGLTTMMREGEFDESLNRDGTDWQQSLESDGKRIKPTKPKYKAPTEAEKLSGERAVSLVEQMFNMGGHITIPLVHSGIWVTLRSVTSEDYVSLREKLEREKDEFGKQTLGASFSNSRVYINHRVMEFIEEHVIDTSVEGLDPTELRSFVKINDLLVLAAALGYSLYPNGFDYVSACTGDDNCDYVHRSKIKIANCIWYDRLGFSQSQTAFMVDRGAKRTREEVRKYQQDLGKVDGSWTYKNIVFNFTIPTVTDNVTAGYRWLSDIEISIKNAFEQDALSRTNMKEYMSKRIVLTALRQYAHFISSITFTDNDGYIDERDDIDNILSRFSNHNEVSNGLMKAITTFIDSNTKSLVAIPRFECPKCHNLQTEDIEKHPYLIPIDPINLFFMLGDQRIQFGSQN